MIQLQYLHTDTKQELGYQSYLIVQQAHNNKPFMVLQDDELLGELEFKNGLWTGHVELPLTHLFIQDAGKFISQQAFFRIPPQILTKANTYVREVVVASENEIIVICRPGIDFKAFQGLFEIFTRGLMEQNDFLNYRVFDAEFDKGF